MKRRKPREEKSEGEKERIGRDIEEREGNYREMKDGKRRRLDAGDT